MAFVYWIHLPEHTDMFSEGYVGITTETVAKRYKRGHLSSARTGSKLRVHNAIRKYGDSLVVTTVLEADIDYCQSIENKLRPSTNIGWNHGIGGASPRKGSKASDETKKKLSVALKGRKVSETTLQNMCAAQSLRVYTEEAKERLRQVSLSRKGMPLTDEHKANLSKNAARIGVFNAEARSKAKEFHNNQPPWERTKSNKDMWARSCEIFEILQLNATAGEVTISNTLNVAAYQVRRILKRIRDGWQPPNDPVFTEWLQDYKLKEATNA